MDVSRIERIYMALCVMLVLAYMIWIEFMGYSEGLFFLFLMTLGTMAYLYVLFVCHFDGLIEINFY